MTRVTKTTESLLFEPGKHVLRIAAKTGRGRVEPIRLLDMDAHSAARDWIPAAHQ
jgi:hypothetical protein